MFKNLFGRKDKGQGAPALAIVRNITIGRSVVLDPLAWRRFGDETRFELDRDTLEITAQGVIRLNEGDYVHRFYTDDHLMLQAVSGREDGSDAGDFTLFMPWLSTYPPDRAAKAAWLERLRQPLFTDAGLPEYGRYWFADSDAPQDPVGFWESVYEDRSASEATRIYQTCMLYHRSLPGEGRELLLAIEQEVEGGDLSDEIMVGIPLEVGEFRA